MSMAEIQKIEMPKNEQKQKKNTRLIASACVLLLCLGLVAAMIWMMQKKENDIVSVYALVDGMVYSVAPEITTKIEKVLVVEGDQVKEGQAVALLEAHGYTQKVQEAEQEIVEIRPPDMPEIEHRLKEATEAEAGTVSRIAAVRHEEERKKQAYDTAVMRHVQAELAMRSAEVRYGIGSSEYRKYQAQEESARIHKQRAEESFEKAAKVRAALNQELSRIHYEIQEAKK